MVKYFIKVDSEMNPITNPESEGSLVFALGEDFNKNNEYVEYRLPPEPELTEVSYPAIPEYILKTDDSGYKYFEPKRLERQFSQAEKTFIFIVARRNHILAATDWLVLPGTPVDDAELQQWYAYRQALRDLPALYPNVSSADEVVWPEMPNSTRMAKLRTADEDPQPQQ